jgi:hypothetical protein
MELVQQAIEWIKQNPIIATAIIIYLLANFAPRPHPDSQKGWVKIFWQVVDRLCVLSSSRVPGRLKMILLDSPAPPPKPEAPPAKEPDKTADGAAADSVDDKEKEGAPNE